MKFEILEGVLKKVSPNGVWHFQVGVEEKTLNLGRILSMDVTLLYNETVLVVYATSDFLAAEECPLPQAIFYGYTAEVRTSVEKQWMYPITGSLPNFFRSLGARWVPEKPRQYA